MSLLHTLFFFFSFFAIGNSVIMKREGPDRVLKRMQENGVAVCQLATDRSPTVKSYRKKERPTVDHQFGVWPFVKSVAKKFHKACQKKEFENVRMWIPSIANHMWWSAATCGGDKTLLRYVTPLPCTRPDQTKPQRGGLLISIIRTFLALFVMLSFICFSAPAITWRETIGRAGKRKVVRNKRKTNFSRWLFNLKVWSLHASFTFQILAHRQKMLFFFFHCFREIWQSAAHHITDVHSWTNATKFMACSHPPIDQRQGETDFG